MSLSGGFGSIIFRMVIDMDETRLQTISQLQAFLAGTLEVRFGVPDSDDARYAHIVSVTQRFGYARLNRPDKGVVLRYLLATCGYSRAQLTRLLARVLDGQSLHKREWNNDSCQATTRTSAMTLCRAGFCSSQCCAIRALFSRKASSRPAL